MNRIEQKNANQMMCDFLYFMAKSDVEIAKLKLEIVKLQILCVKLQDELP